MTSNERKTGEHMKLAIVLALKIVLWALAVLNTELLVFWNRFEANGYSFKPDLSQVILKHCLQYLVGR